MFPTLLEASPFLLPPGVCARAVANDNTYLKLDFSPVFNYRTMNIYQQRIIPDLLFCS